MLDYTPPLKDAVVYREYSFTGSSGIYKAILRNHPSKEDQTRKIKYMYSLEIISVLEVEPVLYIISEWNETSSSGGSHILGVFSDIGHENHGASNDWALMGRFLDKAISIACERFQIDTARKWMEEKVEIKIRNHKDKPVNVIVKEELFRWVNWKIAQ